IISISLLFIACEEEINTPLNKGGIPDKIEEYNIENGSGFSEITYTIPSKEKVAYISAEYEIREGVKRKAKSSKYKNTIRIEGFPKAGVYKVKLIAVSESEKESEATIVTIEPDDPPAIKALEKLEVIDDFGVINNKNINEFESDLIYALLIKNDLDEWEEVDKYNSSNKNIEITARGYDPTKYTVGIFIRDK